MEKITRLAIFDFDGTLMASGTPETFMPIYEQKMGKPWPHKGFWSKNESLDTDIFDIQPISEVVTDFWHEKFRKNTYTIMMTGRIPKLGKLIEALLDKHELKFDRYIYSNYHRTIVYKTRTLEALLLEFPDIKEITMWDDRDEHVEAFTQWGKNQAGIVFNVIHVKS